MIADHSQSLALASEYPWDSSIAWYWVSSWHKQVARPSPYVDKCCVMVSVFCRDSPGTLEDRQRRVNWWFYCKALPQHNGLNVPRRFHWCRDQSHSVVLSIHGWWAVTWVFKCMIPADHDAGLNAGTHTYLALVFRRIVCRLLAKSTRPGREVERSSNPNEVVGLMITKCGRTSLRDRILFPH